MGNFDEVRKLSQESKQEVGIPVDQAKLEAINQKTLEEENEMMQNFQNKDTRGE